MTGLFTRDLDAEQVFGDHALGWSSLHGSRTTAIPAVYAAVSLIADQFASMPMATFGTAGKDVDAAEPTPLPAWLANPDPWLNGNTDWRYQAAVSLKLRGNAYGLVAGSGSSITSVRWLHPDWVTVDESNFSRPVYRVNGIEKTLYAAGGDLLHIREFVQAGSVKGLSPIELFRTTFETAEFAARYGNDWFRHSSVPSGLLAAKTRGMKSADAIEAKRTFMDAAKASQPVILPGEWDYTKLTVTPEEAQFLATIKATATTIAAIFRVSPEDIGGEAGNSRTYSNREMDQQVLNTRTLLPLDVRFAEAMKVLLPRDVVIRFDADALALPSMLERARTDTEELKNGSATLPEVRRRRGRRALTEQEVNAWQENFVKSKSQSEALAESISTSITKEA